MDDSKRLVVSFLKFLEDEVQSGRHDSDSVESIEVASQCLQQAYKLEDVQPLPDAKPLLEIFTGTAQVQNSSSGPSHVQKSSAEHFREEGNSFMKTENYDKAIDCYTMAISLDRTNAVFYCNRAAAHTKTGNHTDAIADCEEAIKINPLYSKAYGRLGFVYLSIGNHAKAVQYYEKALQLEPNNANYKANLEIAKEKTGAPADGASEKPQMPPGAPNLGGLDLNNLLSNPAVMNMAQSFMSNPQMQSMVANLMGGMMQGGGSSSDTPQPSANTNPTPSAPQNVNVADVFSATQQFAEQMQRTNPELVNQLKSQFQQGTQKGPDNNPPGV